MSLSFLNPINYIKSFGSFLKGGTGAAEKAMDGLINGADKLFLTTEEKLDYNQNATKLWIEIQKAIREEGSIRSITRRIFSLSCLFSYLFLAFLCIVFFKIDREFSLFIYQIMEGKLGILTLGAGAFYLGPTMIANAVNKIKKG